MSVPRQAFKRSLKKLYDYLDLNLGAEGALPLNEPESGDALKLLRVNAAEDDYELVSVVSALNLPHAHDVDGALTTSGTVILGKGSAGAYTLAAPGAGTDGTHLYITSKTAYAHVITIASTSLLDGTSTAKGKATYAAQIGATLHLVAANQKWNLVANTNVTLAAS